MNIFETADNIEAYNKLAEAVVTLACEDYRSYRKQLKKQKKKLHEIEELEASGSEDKPDDIELKKRDLKDSIRLLESKITEIEKFLPSPYGMMLSHQLGDVILEKLQNE